jgi:putative hydrolase of the HAD superfamily
MKEEKITTLLLDIGGILLTNGWDRNSRKEACTLFKLDYEEVDERHHLTFDAYESGKLTLEEYLDRTIFYDKRSFTKEEFKKFMFSQSMAIGNSVNFFKEIKTKYGLRVIALSNEARELTEYRIKKFKLNELFDAFISSCFVHLRKPDADIYKLACDISNTPPANALFIDDRLMFVQVAQSHGIKGFHYRDQASAEKYLQTVLGNSEKKYAATKV